MSRQTNATGGGRLRWPSRRRLWLVAVPIAIFLAFVAAMAWADPQVPTPSPGPAPKPPGSSATPQPGPNPPAPSPAPTTPATGPSWTPKPGTSPAPPDPQGKPVKDLSIPPTDAGDGLLQPFNVTDREGVPISAYSVSSDTGEWDDFDLKIWNVLAVLFFSVARWVVGFACWLLQWALGFGLAGILVKPVDGIATTIRDQVINRLGLPSLFLMIAAVFAGWQIMFRNRSRGFAEAGLSLVIAAVATTVLVSPAQVLLGTDKNLAAPAGSTMLLSEDGLLGTAKNFSLQVSSLVLSKDPSKVDANPEQVSKPIKDALVDALIVKPTQLMQYGRTFDGACAKAYGKYKVVEYNWGQMGLNAWEGNRANPAGGPTYLQQLQDAGANFLKTCEQSGVEPEAKKASADMAFSALFVAIAAVIVVVLLVLITGGFLVAQGWLAFQAIQGHWALAAGILPGGGRATLWRWVSAVIKSVLSVVLAILFLAIFILIILALIDADTGKVLATKFVAIDLTAIAALAGQKKIKETSRQIAVNLNRRLANARVGGSRNSVFSSPGRYAETAPGLKQIWGDSKAEARKVTQPIGKAGRRARDLWVGPQKGRAKGGKLRAAARLATNVAVAAGTGGTATAAKMAAQNAAKQHLRKRIATAAANKLAQTRGGRATMATGKAAAMAARYGAKAGKFAVYATAGAPVSVPRGVKATKRGAQAAGVRAAQVRSDLMAAKDRASTKVGKKVDEASAFMQEYRDNVGTAARFVGRQGAYLQLGLAQPLAPQQPTTGVPRAKSAATAPRVPGPAPQPSSGLRPAPTSASTAGLVAPSPKAEPQDPEQPPAPEQETDAEAPQVEPAGDAQPAAAGPEPAEPSVAPEASTAPPSAPARRLRRATRPAGPANRAGDES
ncbi:hypothetical protein [Kitasatospora sp. MBT63]|uniref:hypothetical protein n=1 Tax=Kitasatospora sp. MBT63 TaxID=1444768 RepID=UPI000A77091A|nr:hypothetical protein [Kitasatospora sp. MBT63]